MMYQSCALHRQPFLCVEREAATGVCSSFCSRKRHSQLCKFGVYLQYLFPNVKVSLLDVCFFVRNGKKRLTMPGFSSKQCGDVLPKNDS